MVFVKSGGRRQGVRGGMDLADPRCPVVLLSEWPEPWGCTEAINHRSLS